MDPAMAGEDSESALACRVGRAVIADVEGGVRTHADLTGSAGARKLELEISDAVDEDRVRRIRFTFPEDR